MAREAHSYKWPDLPEPVQVRKLIGGGYVASFPAIEGEATLYEVACGDIYQLAEWLGCHFGEKIGEGEN